MIYFKNEIDARQFSEKQESYIFHDLGAESEEGRRYAVQVLPEGDDY